MVEMDDIPLPVVPMTVPSLPLILGSALVALVAYIAGTAAYNRWLHPLRNIPGPFLAHTTYLYKWYLFAALPPRGMKLHEKYGSIVRVAPNLLLVNDPKLLPLLYNRHADKTSFYSSWMFDKVSPMFQIQDHAHHARLKTIVSECCSMQAILTLEGRFDERITELCETLDRRFASTGERFDFSEYLSYFLSDTYTHMAYCQPSKCVVQGRDAHGQIAALHSVYGLAVLTALFPPITAVLHTKFFQRYIAPYVSAFRGLDDMTKFYEEDLARRSQPERKLNRGFLDNVWSSTHPTRTSLTSVEVKAEYIVFTSAALDGVTAFMSPFVDNLLSRPDLLERVLQEVADAKHRGLISRPVVQYEEIVAHLPYFNACISEQLRFGSPVETMLPRHAPPTGLIYNGHFIPPGTEMGASPWLVHRDKTVFGQDADEFRPERWLQETAAVAQMQRYFMAFGYGSRDCAGQSYARLQICKTMLELLMRFEVDCANRHNEPRLLHCWGAVGLYDKQWLRVKKREALFP